MKRQIVITILVLATIISAYIAYKIIRDLKIEELKKQLKNKNVKAFLALIRYAEGTDKRTNPYAVVYGYGHTIKDFSDHPATTGEWTGKTLPDNYCIGAGRSIGCKSTAAGAYQFILPTWKYLKEKLDLKDFSAKSQDIAALKLIDQKDALIDIVEGNVKEAIQKVSKVWASLPGAGYGQSERTMAQLLEKYNLFV